MLNTAIHGRVLTSALLAKIRAAPMDTALGTPQRAVACTQAEGAALLTFYTEAAGSQALSRHR